MNRQLTGKTPANDNRGNAILILDARAVSNDGRRLINFAEIDKAIEPFGIARRIVITGPDLPGRNVRGGWTPIEINASVLTLLQGELADVIVSAARIFIAAPSPVVKAATPYIYARGKRVVALPTDSGTSLIPLVGKGGLVSVIFDQFEFATATPLPPAIGIRVERAA